MTATPTPAPNREAMSVPEDSINELIALCNGDPRAAIRTLLVANAYFERELELARVAVSSGYSRGWHHRGTT